MSIKRLSIELANQIAAGEVVERPASVVKELVENSLDAGAKHIEIDIEKGGHKRIRVRDDGMGVVKDELTLALAPYATSKISSIDDLFSIGSLGFRGEALASISAVSRLTLTSKPSRQNEAWSATAQGRDMEVSLKPVAHPNGTSVEVDDLFYNTPARRKFLRAEKTEFYHIDGVVKRIALSRPNTSFVLRHNQKEVRRYPVSADQPQAHRVAQICGRQFVDQAHYQALTYDDVTLRVWVGGSAMSRSTNDVQFSFVNGRAMRDKLLMHAIRQAYELALPDIEQPCYVVFIDVNPKDVDVNVHPAKNEVRFQKQRHVHDLLCKVIHDGLREDDAVAEAHTLHEPRHEYIAPLEANNEALPVTTPPVSAQHQISSGTRTPFVSRPERTSRQASSAYTRLMQTPEIPLASDNRFMLTMHGVICIQDAQLFLLDAQALINAWLTRLYEQATASQPLLMPVAVNRQGIDDNSDRDARVQLPTGFEMTHSPSKHILKSVPATLRHLPWGRVFPHVIAASVGSDEQFFSVIAQCADESVSDQAFSWFAARPDDDKLQLVQRYAYRRELDDFVQWMQQ